MTAIAVTIAGSDPSGGAGLQADLKTFSACGVYGGAVVTATTVQNTCGVSGFLAQPADHVAAQVAAVADDLAVGAWKTGMLADAGIALAVADALVDHAAPVVVDPVMVATSGDRLLDDAAIAVYHQRLLPHALLLTPNRPEAAVLLEREEASIAADPAAAAGDLRALGSAWVLLKGGHSHGERLVDILAGPDGQLVELVAQRLDTPHTHGTGCTLAAACAAFLARGATMEIACTRAHAYLQRALAAGRHLDIGHGRGPVHHAWAWW